VKEKFDPKNPKSLLLRAHSQTSGWSLTEQVGIILILKIILKWSCDFLLYTKKETSSVLFTIKYGCYHGSRSMV